MRYGKSLSNGLMPRCRREVGHVTRLKEGKNRARRRGAENAENALLLSARLGNATRGAPGLGARRGIPAFRRFRPACRFAARHCIPATRAGWTLLRATCCALCSRCGPAARGRSAAWRAIRGLRWTRDGSGARAETAEGGAHGLVGAGFEFGLVASGGFARLAHHRWIDQERAAIDEGARGRFRTPAPAHGTAFALGETQIHPEVAAKRFALGVVPGERTPQKREKSLAEAGDGFGFGLARKSRAGGAGQGALDARGNQQKRFALDRGEQFGFVLGFTGHPQAAEVERIALHEPCGALLLEHEPDHGADHGSGTGG
jgi:hypothetical protein